MFNPINTFALPVVQANTAIDLSGFDTVVLVSATTAAPGAPITFQVRESDAMVFADATLVDPLQLIGGDASLTAANQTAKIGYLGSKRYVFLTSVGGTPDISMALLGAPSSAPVVGA